MDKEREFKNLLANNHCQLKTELYVKDKCNYLTAYISKDGYNTMKIVKSINDRHIKHDETFKELAFEYLISMIPVIKTWFRNQELKKR